MKTLFSLIILIFLVVVPPSAMAQASPTINVATGTYPLPESTFNNMNPITITNNAGSGTVYYTLDGSDPETSSTAAPYNPSNGISLTGNATMNARVQVGASWSPPATTEYVAIDTNAQAVSRTNLLMWYRGDLGVVSSSGKVSRWVDVSGANPSNDAVQGTTGNQPSVVTDSINGFNAVSFDGSSSYLQIPAAVFTNVGATFFIVTKPTTAGASSQMLNFSGSTFPDNLIGISENSSQAPQFTIYNASGGSPTSATSSTAVTANQYQLIEAVQGDVSETTATLFVNGSQVAQNNMMNKVPAASLGTNTLGKSASSSGSQYYPGQIVELLAYSGFLTLSQRVAAEAYFSQKYQISSQIPTPPVISLPSSNLTGPTQVALSAQPNSTIYFTLDGLTTPSTSSPQYSGPINIFYNHNSAGTQTVLQAIAVSNGASSSISTATYVLNPNLWPAPGTGGPSVQFNLTVPTSSIPQ